MEKANFSGRVDGVCKACSNKIGALEAAKHQNLALLDEMTYKKWGIDSLKRKF
jgi:hypothetical protein